MLPGVTHYRAICYISSEGRKGYSRMACTYTVCILRYIHDKNCEKVKFLNHVIYVFVQ